MVTLVSGFYAYCLIELESGQDPPLSLPPQAFLVKHENVAAVLRQMPNSGWRPTRKNIMEHQKILTTLQEECHLLPLRFGTVFKDVAEAQNVIAGNYEEICRLLERVRGRVELGLRVFWTEKAFYNEVSSQKMEKLKREFERGKKDRYKIAIETGKLVEAAVQAKREQYLRGIYEPLSRLAEDSVLNPVTGEKMVFNAAFLVAKDRVPEFDEAVSWMACRHKERLIFKYSGPWPPYNFVTVNW